MIRVDDAALSFLYFSQLSDDFMRFSVSPSLGKAGRLRCYREKRAISHLMVGGEDHEILPHSIAGPESFRAQGP